MQTSETGRPENRAVQGDGKNPQSLPEWQAALDAQLHEDAARSLALMAFWAVPLAHARAFWARLRGPRD